MSLCRLCALVRECDFRKRYRSSKFSTIEVCNSFIRRALKKNHRAIMAEYLERELGHKEFVHHVNGIHSDNRLDNLFLCSPSEHIRIHRLMKKGVSRADSLKATIDRRWGRQEGQGIKTAASQKRSNAFMEHSNMSGRA